MSLHPDTNGHDLQAVLMQTRLMLGKAQDDARAWEAMAKQRGNEIAALRKELAELQENYHLLNKAVAKVLRKPTK